MSGSWSNSYQTSLTLPTGATSGARIVIGGDQDAILIYDTDGNLIASESPTDTMDGEGNTVLAGVANYAGSEYVQLAIGNLLLGVLPNPATPTFVPNPGSLGISGDSRSIGLQSASNQDTPDTVNWRYESGDVAAGTGTAGYPHSSNWRGDIWVGGQAGGNLVKSYVPAGQSDEVPETWHIVGATDQPAYDTGWDAGSTSGTFQSLQFRLDAEDNVLMSGVFHATAAAPSNLLFTLPEDYWPAQKQRLGLDTYITQGSVSAANAAMIVNTSGIVQVFCSAAVAASQNFAVNAVIPRGNLP